METLWYTAVRVNNLTDPSVRAKIADAYNELYELGHHAVWVHTVEGYTAFCVSYSSAEVDEVCGVLKGVINPVHRIRGPEKGMSAVEFLDLGKTH